MSKTGTAVSISALALLLLAACANLGDPKLRTADGIVHGCDYYRCVSSVVEDSPYYVAPIRYSGTQDAARLALVRILSQMEGAELMAHRQDYVHVKFQSKLMRFTDDLELMFAPRDKRVHVRSASRVGVYDFNHNRERVEALRAQFEALQP